MVYRVTYNDLIVEFVRNKGRVFLEGSTPAEAIELARGIFEEMRDEEARELGTGQYLVTFKVDLGYKLTLLRQVERAAKLLRSRFRFDRARYVDQYIVATIYQYTGQPDYLKGLDIAKEVQALREASVVAREVHSLAAFIDLDIAIHNHIELNCKPGHRSRILRGPRPT
ncbi:hypothetical protein GF377_00520 [candidate division GN15 bacterium]|nr:hypothetical protein [candidate division GN15 bacterium]